MVYSKIHLKLFLSAVMVMLVSSCASPISQRYRQEAAPNLTFPMVLENPSKYEGKTVIWGGTILKPVKHKGGSELFILELPLGSRDRPEVGENARGEFIAESKYYLDPLIYRKGRKVTVAGKVTGGREVVSEKSKRAYTYPMVAIEEVYLWKKARPAYPYYPYWWGSPYRPYGWRSGGPYYWWGPGPYWDGFYGDEFYGEGFGDEGEFEGNHDFDEPGEEGEEGGR